MLREEITIVDQNVSNRRENKLDIKIIIATHKKYRMPQDNIYVPLHVGAEGKKSLSYQEDNTGDNISRKNMCYCELTGMYWMWKNLKADYLGLAHYRRHFSYMKKNGVDKDDGKWRSILNSDEAQDLCRQYDIIVPLKRHYVIETLGSHYAHTHYKEHLVKTRKIIEEKHPRMLESFDRVLKRTSGYMFNMFIMRSDMVDEYCNFLFDVLFALEKEVDTNGYSDFQARYPGRIGEILFNVWLEYNMTGLSVQDSKQCLRVKEIGLIHMEPINWLDKGTAFLNAKFLGKRYEHGF